MLENIRIASPCSADWEKMPGNDRVRHCQACNLNVYNLPAFTEQEIRELLANRQGRLCGRLYQRSDGTAITQNCPVGLRAVTRRISRIAGAVLSFLAPSFIAVPQAHGQSYTETNVSTASVSVEVLDQSGATIPGATATLTDTSRNQKLYGTADKRGRFILRAAIGGRHTLEVSAPGFRTFTYAVELRAGQVLSLPVVLSVAASMGDIVIIEPSSQPSRNSAQPGAGVAGINSTGPRPMQQ